MYMDRYPWFILILIVLLVITRSHYVAWLPDASWAVFFISGFYFYRWQYWLFPLLICSCVLVDAWVITSQGMDFWQHYCISIGYALLLPAQYVMWYGGYWLKRRTHLLNWASMRYYWLSLIVAISLCHLLAQSGFYWFSTWVIDPTFGSWIQNYLHWLPSYFTATTVYVSLIVGLDLIIQAKCKWQNTIYRSQQH